MKLMTISIAGDNIFVCLAAMLTFATSLVIHDSNALWGLLGGMLACSVIGQFFANTGCMALEKDWVPVIAGEKGSGDIRPMGEGDREDDVEVKKSLAILNSSLRRIDLTCKFLAPMAFGVMLQFLPYKTDRKIQIGSSVILVWNLATLVPELLLARSIYNDVPELANRPGNQVQRSSQISSKQAHGCTSIPLLGGLIEGWDTWLSSSVMGLSLGYTMLYATVLSPGPLLTAYLKTVGIPEGLVGASMGLGAVFGLVGTVIFRPLASCMPLAGVGFVTIWLWCAFLAPCALVALISDGLGASMDTQQRGYVILICVTVSAVVHNTILAPACPHCPTISLGGANVVVGVRPRRNSASTADAPRIATRPSFSRSIIVGDTVHSVRVRALCSVPQSVAVLDSGVRKLWVRAPRLSRYIHMDLLLCSALQQRYIRGSVPRAPRQRWRLYM